MSKTTEKKGKPSAAADSTAGEAWEVLASLVYPPPFLAIAQESGLRPAAFGALRVLDEPRAMSEIAAFLRCDNSNVTGIVDGLEARGLAERTPAPGDRRVKLIALTAEGRRLRARLMREARKPPAWLKSLSPADQRTLRDVLRRATA
jgi:DNA-binding MarR family transcriptional regulator